MFGLLVAACACRQKLAVPNKNMTIDRKLRVRFLKDILVLNWGVIFTGKAQAYTPLSSFQVDGRQAIAIERAAAFIGCVSWQPFSSSISPACADWISAALPTRQVVGGALAAPRCFPRPSPTREFA